MGRHSSVRPAGRGRLTRRTQVAVTWVMICALTGLASPAQATTWAVTTAAGSRAQSAAGATTGVTAPTNQSAACNGATQILLTWTAAPHRTSYTVNRSSTSATTGYSAVATGVSAAATSYTDTPGNGTYWYEITAVDGTWASATTSATAQRRISGGGCT